MKKFLFLLFALQCSLNNAASAQNPGSLSGGTTFSMWLFPYRVDVALQSDGKIVAGGNSVARFNANLLLDTTFSGDGIDVLKIHDTIYNCMAIAIQSDGRILFVARPGIGNMSPGDFQLVRCNADGSPDSTFDSDGAVRTDLNSGSEDRGYELAIQPDGKIIVAGESDGVIAVCRYDSNGLLDNTFDNDGKLFINSSSGARSVKLQTDGKILVVGGSVVVRLNTDGSFDNTFGTNGVVALSYGMSDLAVQPDGKIVMAGGSFLVVRLDAAGNMDNSFGNGGMTTPITQPGNIHYYSTSVALQPDGRILAGGYVTMGQLANVWHPVLRRYEPNGSIDGSFVAGVSGLSYNVKTFASAITPDFNIVLVGLGDDLVSYYVNWIAKYHLGWLLDVNTVSSNNESFVVSPNPASDIVTISAAKVDNGVWHLRILDITGRQLSMEDIVTTDGSIHKNVSFEALPSGVYFLQLENGTDKMVSRVVKHQ